MDMDDAYQTTDALEFIHDTCIVVSSFTFHGTITNINMVKIMGAIFNGPEQLLTHFTHAISGKNVP